MTSYTTHLVNRDSNLVEDLVVSFWNPEDPDEEVTDQSRMSLIKHFTFDSTLRAYSFSIQNCPSMVHVSVSSPANSASIPILGLAHCDYEVDKTDYVQLDIRPVSPNQSDLTIDVAIHSLAVQTFNLNNCRLGR